MSKCTICEGKGYYVGIAPPGREVKVPCHCGSARKPVKSAKPSKPKVLKIFSDPCETTLHVSEVIVLTLDAKESQLAAYLNLSEAKKTRDWLNRAIKHLESRESK